MWYLNKIFTWNVKITALLTQMYLFSVYIQFLNDCSTLLYSVCPLILYMFSCYFFTEDQGHICPCIQSVLCCRKSCWNNVVKLSAGSHRRGRYLIIKQTDFNQAVISTHSRSSRLMSSIQVQRRASRCITRTPWDDQVQEWVTVESLLCTYTFFWTWQPPGWCAFCTLKEMIAIRIFCLSHLSYIRMFSVFTPLLTPCLSVPGSNLAFISYHHLLMA